MEPVFSLFRMFNMANFSGVRAFRFCRNYVLYKTTLKIKVCCEYPTGIRNVHNDIIERLSKSEPLIIMCNKEKCNVRMVFCPIVSRAGTDIEAALSRLSGESLNTRTKWRPPPFINQTLTQLVKIINIHF